MAFDGPIPRLEIKAIGGSFRAAFAYVGAALDDARALRNNINHPQIHIGADLRIGTMCL